MSRTITIDPITRIEGHAKITIHLDKSGGVEDARFHVTQFRGFEKFVEGRPFQEMPAITARICGICPVSHLMASAKTCDAIMAVRIPPTAEKLRRVMNLGQLVQSHALSFFHLCSPDLLLGMDTPVPERNILGVAAKHPDVARDGIRLRQFGQQVIEWLGGKRVHPGWVVPGGVNRPLEAETRDRILGQIPEMLTITQRALDLYKGVAGRFADEIRTFSNFESLFAGLVDENGNLEHYAGGLRFVDATRKIVADGIDVADYERYIGEAPLPFSYLKSPYYKPLGLDAGCYRVGPLARLKVAERCGTPLADAALDEFRTMTKESTHSSFHFHHARLIEIMFGLERMRELLKADDILDPRVRATGGPNRNEGFGISEAPRGILIHHYKVDDNGLMTWANLIIATGHNNIAMNRGIKQAAIHFVHGDKLTEGALNRVEAVIRCFDPCLSCSTHALGTMPMHIQLLDAEGTVLDACRR